MKLEFIEAGKIVNTHGTRGEVKLEVWTDSPEFLGKIETVYIDGRPYKNTASRPHKRMLLMKLEGVDDINAAMELKGSVVTIARDDAPLPEGGYFLAELVGARCTDPEGREIGTLTEIIDAPAGFIYVIKGQDEHLVPAVPEFVISANPEEGVVVVRLIEGM